MSSFAFWNNKGGVGKSFLCFVTATEYATQNKNTDVYVIDLCPQGNLSEILLAGQGKSEKALRSFFSRTPRCSVAGYIEERLTSPFQMSSNISKFVIDVKQYNNQIPANLKLICGDNLLEILSEAIRQTSQLSMPQDAWKKVISWIRDLTSKLSEISGTRDSVFFIDCNPSFAIYTQLAVVASNYIIVPFTADDSSRRGIENIMALLYGEGDKTISSYARLLFFKKAKDYGVSIPRLHTFVSNRVTLYDGKPSRAFKAAEKNIKALIERVYKEHRSYFAYPNIGVNNMFINIPDYHGACIVSTLTGTPISKIKPGPHNINEERIQLNKGPLDNYKRSLEELVKRI